MGKGQMGQILDFLRSVSVHFGSASQNVLKVIFKKSQVRPILPNLDVIFDIAGAECDMDLQFCSLGRLGFLCR